MALIRTAMYAESAHMDADCVKVHLSASNVSMKMLQPICFVRVVTADTTPRTSILQP